MNLDDEYDETLPARSPYAHKISNLSWHLTDHAFGTIVGRDVKSEHKNYLKLEPINVDKFELPEKYVVVTTAYTSDTRVWNVKSVNETIDYIISKGYVPVFLGKSFAPAYKNVGLKGKFTEVDYTKGINLIDNTSLLEAHGIMSKAKAVVGLDNGLLHLAALTETPIVYGFTTVASEHRLPYRHNELGWNCFVVEPPKEVKCRGCQSNWNFADEKVDFRFCPYGDYVCIDSLESKLWIEQLEKVL